MCNGKLLHCRRYDATATYDNIITFSRMNCNGWHSRVDDLRPTHPPTPLVRGLLLLLTAAVALARRTTPPLLEGATSKA